MDTYETAVDIRAPIDVVWRALTDADEMRAWSGESASCDPVEGGEFMMFGGDVRGHVIELSEPYLLVQAWRFPGWSSDSVVRFELSARPSGTTTIRLAHCEIPADYEDIESSWHPYYLDKMKRHLEGSQGQLS